MTQLDTAAGDGRSDHRSPGPVRLRRRYRVAPGFTLIEVLATLLLVAIVLPVTMRGIALATAATTTARRRAEAGALAESKMAELVASGRWSDGRLSGDFRGDTAFGADAGTGRGDVYRWSADVRPHTRDGVHYLDVSVLWTGRGQTQSVTMSTLVYEPPPRATDGGAGPERGRR